MQRLFPKNIDFLRDELGKRLYKNRFVVLNVDMQEVTDDNFEQEVLKSDKPVLVDFWAPWCQPCLVLGPIIEEVATELGDKVKVVKMNVQDHAKVPGEMGIRSIPTLKVFHNGQETNQMVGSGPKEKVLDLVKDFS